MKKLFTILSILFALLAGFNACGGSDTGSETTDETQTEDEDVITDPGDSGDTGDPGDTGDTFYGIAYCEFRKIV